MIIYAEGWDADTKGYKMPYYPIAINTKDILYARGHNSKGDRTAVYLRHNMTKENDGGTYTASAWVVLNMPMEEFCRKWKEAEEKCHE